MPWNVLKSRFVKPDKFLARFSAEFQFGDYGVNRMALTEISGG
jgi:hypothetical protein